jgi:glucose/arabinose dehydrogenase
MLSTEHGPNGRDEINIIEPGKNYGWPEIRGDEIKEGMETPLLQSGYGEPIEEFTWAPSGATFVDSGPWKGMFLFAGLRSRSLWQLELDENNKVKELNRLLQNKFRRLRSVEQGLNGNIFIITSNLDRNNLPIGKDFLIELEVVED